MINTGHLAAIITIIIWGTTFISTKVLLQNFNPIEILFFRFIIGFLTLILIYPKKLKTTGLKQELYFISAGLCGVTLYFLFENIALTYSNASNVGVIISISPFFTAIFANIFLKNERLKLNFFIGFFLSIVGIFIISFNGSKILKINPIGDILAVFAAIIWSLYSILVKKINAFNYNIIASTRRIFLYGLLLMIPFLFILKFRLDLNRFKNITSFLNIIYLGFGASALCFVTWGFAVKTLGAVKTSVYIYAVPVITLVTSAVILKENINFAAILGTFLIITGLFISENKNT